MVPLDILRTVVFSLCLVLTITVVTHFSFYKNYLAKAVCAEEASQPSIPLFSSYRCWCNKGVRKYQ